MSQRDERERLAADLEKVVELRDATDQPYGPQPLNLSRFELLLIVAALRERGEPGVAPGLVGEASFANALREARREYGISLRALAAALETTPLILGEVERGKRDPSSPAAPQQDREPEGWKHVANLRVHGFEEFGVAVDAVDDLDAVGLPHWPNGTYPLYARTPPQQEQSEG